MSAFSHNFLALSSSLKHLAPRANSRSYEPMSSFFDLDQPSLVETIYPKYANYADFNSVSRRFFSRPLDLDAPSVQNWVRSTVDRFDLKPTTWAKEAGIAPSTLNRFVDQPTEISDRKITNLTANTINKLSNALAPLLEKYLEKEWLDVGASSDNVEGFAWTESSLLGYISDDFVDPKKRATTRDLEFPYVHLNVPAKIPYNRFSLGAFEVTTEIYDPVFGIGDYIFGAPIFILNESPQPESYVVYQTVDSRGFVRTELRRFVMDPSSRGWLMPIGTPPKGTRAIPEEQEAISHRSAAATFVVVGVHRHLV